MVYEVLELQVSVLTQRTNDFVHLFMQMTLQVSDSNNRLVGMLMHTPLQSSPVVQHIVSLTSLLEGQLAKCFITFLPNVLIFFVEKI